MNRVIKIFIGSSIKEFERERETIENFIYRISKNFEKSHGISVEPLLCENFDDAYSKIRKQEEYNEKIRESELCFFLFFTKAGEFTREEFEVARKKFEESGKPKIYTYFKALGEEKGDDSLYAFMEELDKVFGHYYGTFEHIDTVKLRILLALKLQEMDFLDVKVAGGICTVDGKPTLPLENVSEFANNQLIKEFRMKLDELEGKYYTLKARYEKGECSDSEEQDYIEIASDRQNLIESLEELRRNIFNISLRMCKDEIRGEITVRQREAYRLFEAGDLEGANKILVVREILEELNKGLASLDEDAKKLVSVKIGELETKISLLYLDMGDAGRFDEIELIFEAIIPFVMKHGVKINCFAEYLGFLLLQNKLDKAFALSRKATEAFSKGYGTDDEKAKFYYNLSHCYAAVTEYGEALKIIFKALDYYKKTIKESDEINDSFLAMMYSTIGMYYYQNQDSVEAEKNYKLALDIYINISETSSEERAKEMAEVMTDLAVLYRNTGNREEAKKYYDAAEDIFKRLYAEKPEETVSDMGVFYMNLGVFYSETDSEKALKYRKEAVKLLEAEEKNNPERIMPTLGLAYMGLAKACMAMQDYDFGETEQYIKKTVKYLSWATKKNPAAYWKYLISLYASAGGFYDRYDNVEKAEKFYLAIEVVINFVEASLNSLKTVERLDCYEELLSFYLKRGLKEKSKKLMENMINILEPLSQKIPSFLPYLTKIYYNYSTLTGENE